MNEKELEKKYEFFLKEEEKIKKIELDNKVKIVIFIYSILIFFAAIIVVFLHHSLFSFFWNMPPTKEEVFSTGRVFSVIFSPLILTSAILTTFFPIYFFFSTIKNTKEKIKESLKINIEKKELKSKTEERKEFFRFYELMKDDDFRKGYLEAKNPDKILSDKIMTAARK
jgi:NADH:ubiquinone oxidoreductase subunit 5 (subunit L)/multisubunit Na+/H+ antiporter MnhA subunit